MIQLHPSANASEIVAVNSIVFVHGLFGNRETTWTHKPTKTFWPLTLLASDLPSARILTFGYDADVVRAIDTTGSNTLRDHGKSLANDLALRRMRSHSVHSMLRRKASFVDRIQNHLPIIFVAHSLGGLVVEQVRSVNVVP